MSVVEAGVLAVLGLGGVVPDRIGGHLAAHGGILHRLLDLRIDDVDLGAVMQSASSLSPFAA